MVVVLGKMYGMMWCTAGEFCLRQCLKRTEYGAIELHEVDKCERSKHNEGALRAAGGQREGGPDTGGGGGIY